MLSRRDSYLEVSTTRIIRALRPLRTKCEYLSASRPLPPKPCATYTSSSRQKESSVGTSSTSFGKLAAATFTRNDHHPVNQTLINLQLSKKIKEVTDAFRNIAQIALGINASQRHILHSNDPSNHQRIPSLAALCCTIVGEHMEAEVQAHQETQDSVSTFDDEDITVITELYDTLPPHYRRYAVISHALSIILNACPNYPDLHGSLLEVTSKYSLPRESELLLMAIFSEVFSPHTPFTKDSIFDASNSHYLISLHNKCCTPNSGISSRTFTRILVNVLSKSYHQRASDVWTSPALSLLMRHIRSLDIPSYMNLCAGIIGFLSVSVGTQQRGKGIGISPEQLWMLLGKKLRGIPSRLCSTRDFSDDDLLSVFDFLSGVASCGLQRHVSEGSSEARKLFATLVLCCLSSVHLSNLGPDGEDVLVRLLSELEPRPDSYSKIISSVYPSDTAEDTQPPSLEDWKVYTTPLRTRRLYAHEAAFWSSVLQHVENLAFKDHRTKPHAYRPLLLSLRMELVERVGEVERLQFNANGVSSKAGSGLTVSSTDKESDWRWDDLVDCWVRKTPLVPKKRKRPIEGESPIARRNIQMKRTSLEQWKPVRVLEYDLESTSPSIGKRLFTTSSRTSGKRQSAGSSRSSVMSGAPPTLSRTSQNRSPSLQSTLSSTSERFPDCENALSFRPTSRKTRRVSNFTSILADAQMNRVVLHDSDGDDESIIHHSSSDTQSSRKHQMDDDFEVVPGVCAADQLSSDDLNLFAYPSSPIKRY